ncbi:MAG: DNRLRE domain-containing protein [bacterium]
MRYVLFLAILAMITSAAFVNAAEVTLNPAADAPIWAGAPTRNYGSSTYGYWGYFNGNQRTLVKWDCSTVTGAVSSAQLIFRMMQNNYGTGKMWACKVTATWAENTVTYNTQPTHDDAGASRLLDIDWVSGNGPHTVACTTAAVAIIQAWVSTPATNYGVLLKKNPESGTVPRCYPYMKESAYPGVQLKVVFTTAVAPASLGKIKTLFK